MHWEQTFVAFLIGLVSNFCYDFGFGFDLARLRLHNGFDLSFGLDFGFGFKFCFDFSFNFSFDFSFDLSARIW